MSKEHGTISSSDIFPYDPNGRGIHSIQGFNSVSDETQRESIVQQNSDRGRVIEQTGGTLPGYYVADGSGNWFYLGGDPNQFAGAINLTSFITTENVDLYVDNINGNDSNDGSQSNPLKTLIEAENKIPYIVNHRVIVHILPFDISIPNMGAYDWPVFRERIISAPILIVSEDFQTIISGTAQVGSTQTKIITSGGLIVDEYVDTPTFVRITSGGASGDIRTIGENNITDIYPDYSFSDVINDGDSYELLRSVVKFSVPITDGIRILAKGTNNISSGSGAGLFIINAVIDVQTEAVGTLSSLYIKEIPVIFFGVWINFASLNSFISDSKVKAGKEEESNEPLGVTCDTIRQYLPTLCPTKLAVSGWGLSLTSNSSFDTHIGGFDGFIVNNDSLAFRSVLRNSIHNAWSMGHICGGRVKQFICGTYTRPSYVHISVRRSPGDPIKIDFKVRYNGTGIAFNCQRGIVVARDCDIYNGGSGLALHCEYFQSVTIIDNSIGISVGGIGMSTEKGGKIEVGSNTTFSGGSGDFSEDDGVTIRNWSELVTNSFFWDLNANPTTHKIEGSGSCICKI